MPDPSSLYPQPSQNNNTSILAGNPLQMIGTISQLNANARFNKEFQAKQAVGAAFQNALRPDGTVDVGALSQGLKAPAASFAAPEAIGTLLDQRGKMIENDTNNFKLGAATNGAAQDFIAGLAGNPKIQPDDVYNSVVEFARRNPGIPSSQITSLLSTMPKTGKSSDIQNWAKTYQNIQAGPATTIQRTAGPPGTGGEATSQPLGQANVGGAQPIELPPGQKEAIAANQGEFVKDQTGAAQILGGLRPLQNALPLLEKMRNSDFGPGSEGFAQVKSALITAGIIPPNTTDVETRQEANKYLKNYAGQTQSAGRSDQALSQALGSNPNLDLTQGANLALIKNQIGMDRMSAALPVAFGHDFPAPKDKAQYLDYKSNFFQSNDPRAFSFDVMTPEERRSVIDSLGKPDSAAYKKFARSYDLAKKAQIFAAPNGQ